MLTRDAIIKRIGIALVLELLIAWDIAEVSFVILGEKNDHAPQRIELVIPTGTADRVAKLLAIIAVGVLVRLGTWQLDRLAQRRMGNARVIAQQQAEPFSLDSTVLDADLLNMEYRTVNVTGKYDLTQQVVLRNQVWTDQPGVHLLTPLIVSGTNETVLVDRGWVPQEDATPDKRSKYDEPSVVTVRGVIRRPQSKPDFGGVPDPPLAPGQTRLDAWNIVNLERISQQVSVPLSPAYIQQSPEANPAHPPYRSKPQLDLTEGPHFSYALQWFTFAAILAIGYPVYVHRQKNRDI